MRKRGGRANRSKEIDGDEMAWRGGRCSWGEILHVQTSVPDDSNVSDSGEESERMMSSCSVAGFSSVGFDASKLKEMLHF